MPRKSLAAIIFVAVVLSAASLLAQEEESRKSFKLLRDSAAADQELDLEEEEALRWEPRIQSGTLEISVGMGFMNLNQTILAHDQIIYKYTDEATSWGDVSMTGDSAFNPSLRLGYNVAKWLGFEGIGGISFCDYSSDIVNRSRRPNEPGAPVDTNEPALGEFDAEARSLLTIQAGLNAVVYPLNIGGDGYGRWHPYLTGGAGRIWYEMNSNYTDEIASAWNYNLGGGLRLLADEVVSVRLEILFNTNELEWTPAEYFNILDEGTTKVPLNEYPYVDGQYQENRVTKFASQSMSFISWSIGAQVSF